MRKIFLLIIILFIVGFLFFYEKNKAIKNTNENEKITNNKTMVEKKQYDTPPAMILEKDKKYKVKLFTSAGEMTIALDADKTPITVNNFVFLAGEKFYDQTIFHRVIKGFMIQGGDPTGTGWGGPGYKFNDEKFSASYIRGTVAMANAGPNTNGSQFFIMHADQPLPADYVVFGHLTDGWETLDKIANIEVIVGAGGEKSKPINPVTIERIEVIIE